MFDNENIKNLNNLELNLYKDILSIKEEVLKMTIRELANKTHVSTTTILRLCKKLGCNGFTDFKFRLELSINEQKNSNINPDITDVINFLQCIENGKFDTKLEQLIKMVKESEIVLFIGSSTSGILAKYGAKVLSSVGKLSLYIDDPYFPSSSRYYNNSLVIALSVSGENRVVIEYINKYRSEGCKIVSITNKEECTISKISDLNLSYYMKESKFANNNITSQIPVVYIIERIGKSLIDKNTIINN